MYAQTDGLSGLLENPFSGSFQSGIGLFSGWVCDASQVEIEINGDPTLTFMAGYGTDRIDTTGVCGDSNNGFGLLFNWNLLGDGGHTVRALVDGVEFDSATFTVTTLGTEFVRGAEKRTCEVLDFPDAGRDGDAGVAGVHAELCDYRLPAPVKASVLPCLGENGGHPFLCPVRGLLYFQ